MTLRGKKLPLYSRDISAFAVTLLFAVLFKWQAKDIIWGLWISSLTVGYITIVWTIASSVINSEPRMRIPAAAAGLFMLLFFTFHFGMFHFVHSIFVNVFFPLIKMDAGFPDIRLIIYTAFTSYWPLVLMSFITKYPDLIGTRATLKDQGAFMKPYSNVIRMHLLIFVFAGLHFAGANRLALYPVLLFYFFPWKDFFRKDKNNNIQKTVTDAIHG